MIYNYVKLEINKYIADYYFKKSILPSLQKQLESMDGMSGLSGREKVQESPQHDGVEKLIIARERISEQIADYTEHVKEYETALESLTDIEKKVIDSFFNSESKEVALDYMEYQLGLPKRSAYRVRETALNKLSMALIG